MSESSISRWDRHFLERALANARMSKDPNTQVGSVLVRDRIGLMDGFNGFPRRMNDSTERLYDREQKMQLVICAERNAIINAAREGISTKGATLYCVATDETGEVWGGPPCIRCTPEVIQAGVAEVVTLPRRLRLSRYHQDMDQCRAWMREAGIRYYETKLK